MTPSGGGCSIQKGTRKQEPTRNRAIHPIKLSKKERKPLHLSSVQQQNLKRANKTISCPGRSAVSVIQVRCRSIKLLLRRLQLQVRHVCPVTHLPSTCSTLFLLQTALNKTVIRHVGPKWQQKTRGRRKKEEADKLKLSPTGGLQKPAAGPQRVRFVPTSCLPP